MEWQPNGYSDDHLPCRRTAERKLDAKYPYVCHAQLNAIRNKNSVNVKGSTTMYVALFQCNECAKLAIQAGIRKLFSCPINTMMVRRQQLQGSCLYGWGDL